MHDKANIIKDTHNSKATNPRKSKMSAKIVEINANDIEDSIKEDRAGQSQGVDAEPMVTYEEDNTDPIRIHKSSELQNKQGDIKAEKADSNQFNTEERVELDLENVENKKKGQEASASPLADHDSAKCAASFQRTTTPRKTHATTQQCSTPLLEESHERTRRHKLTATEPKRTAVRQEELSDRERHVSIPWQLRSQDGEFVYFDGELEKYKPGLSTHYITRWCQVTRSRFSYYKSHWGANCWLSKALLSIPLGWIQSARRVEVIIPEKARNQDFRVSGKTLQHTARRDYQFEIYLKKEVNISALAKSVDYSAYETRGGSIDWLESRNRNYSSTANLRQAKERSLASLRSHAATPLKDPHKTERANRNSAPEPSVTAQPYHLESPIYPDRKVLKGHLMRSPSTSRKSSRQFPENHDPATSQRSQPELQEEKQNQKEEEEVEFDEIYFPTRTEAIRYKAYKQANDAELKEVVLTEEIGIKHPSAWIPTLSSKRCYLNIS